MGGARLAATQGKLAFGTVDTFLLWRLTNGAVHATDITMCHALPYSTFIKKHGTMNY